MDFREWWVYERLPLDTWAGWVFLDEAAKILFHAYIQYKPGKRSDTPPSTLVDLDSLSLPDLLSDAYSAREAIKQHTSWDGDGTWRFSMLPNPSDNLSRLIFAVKQSHGGYTFFASPYRLTYLLEGETTYDTEERRVRLYHKEVEADTEAELTPDMFAAFNLEALYLPWLAAHERREREEQAIREQWEREGRPYPF